MADDHSVALNGCLTKDDIKEYFRLACIDLWNNHVKPALITDSMLLVCKTCLGFTKRDDVQSTHPKEDQLSVGELCIQNRVINGHEFFMSMWSEAVQLMSVHGKILLPKMQSRHVVLTKEEEMKDESSIELYKKRVYCLEDHVKRLSRHVFELEAQKSKLAQETNHIFSRLLHMKNTNEMIQQRSLKLLEELGNLLTPDFKDQTQV